MPLLPGTEPETTTKPFSKSTFNTFNPVMVLRLPPMRPAMRVPFTTRCGHVEPIEPGSRKLCFCPWLAGPPRKSCRFTTP